MVTIAIPNKVLDGIAERARNTQEEICGAILNGVDHRIDNVAPERERTVKFLMDREQQWDVFKKWGGAGDLIIYHSHPHDPARPSKPDTVIMEMNPKITFLIFSCKTGWFRAYRADGERGITEVRIVDRVSTQPDQPGTVATGPTN